MMNGSRLSSITLAVIAMFAVIVALDDMCWKSHSNVDKEDCARKWLKQYAEYDSNKVSECSKLAWHYAMNSSFEKAHTQCELEYAEWIRTQIAIARKFDPTSFSNVTKRQITILNIPTKNAKVTKRLETIRNNLIALYFNATACVRDKCFAPGYMKPLEAMRATKNNTKQIEVWEAYRKATGSEKIKSQFKEMVDLQNGTQVDDELDLEKFEEIMPLYMELHAYVRGNLKKQYKGYNGTGYIPVHMTGDMWGEDWAYLYKEMVPFAKVKSSGNLIEKLRTKFQKSVESMVKVVENVYVSMGFQNLSKSFWSDSIFTIPENGGNLCPGILTEEPRMFFCGNVTRMHWSLLHYFMSAIYYHKAFSNQPWIFRKEASMGIGAAVGYVIELVANKEYLQRVDMADKTNSEKANINILFEQSLSVLPFCTYIAAVIDWRKGVYSGEIGVAKYNDAFWASIEEYQGLKHPGKPQKNGFDAGAQLHISIGVPMLHILLQYPLGFQFYRELCKTAGHTGPLHQCSIFNSKAAGKKLQEMMAAGRSKPWKDTVKDFTGDASVNYTALIDYFAPLYTFLKKENKDKHYKVGWA